MVVALLLVVLLAHQRCRSGSLRHVSKQWLSVVDSPDFIQRSKAAISDVRLFLRKDDDFYRVYVLLVPSHFCT
ncbi:unnamed protein product [Linum trigynum]|uniref:Secreted protein n=1 Tax=Linum trigynum TaxID=586398 RepID=A0AAV2E7B1_9ROSI